jgi:hypothetical protein
MICADNLDAGAGETETTFITAGKIINRQSRIEKETWFQTYEGVNRAATF